MPTFEQAIAIVKGKERKYGLQDNLLRSTWGQESDQSLDIGLKGPELSRGRGHAVGPFQIVPYYHPAADLSSFESQADYAAKLLKEVGLRGYYGEGTAPKGHPTTDEYEREVLSRVETYAYPSGDLATMTEYPHAGGLMASGEQSTGLLADPSAAVAPQEEKKEGFMSRLYGENSPPPGLMFALSFMAAQQNSPALGGLLQYAMQQGRGQQVAPYDQWKMDRHEMERQREEAQAQDLQRRADQLAEIYGVETGIHRTPEQVIQAKNAETAAMKAQRPTAPAAMRNFRAWQAMSAEEQRQYRESPFWKSPAAGKKTTEAERESMAYLERMRNEKELIETIENPPQRGGAFETRFQAWAPHSWKTPEGQRYRAAAERWIIAKMRRESGAQIADKEMQREFEAFFPQPGDAPQVIEDKKKAREKAEESMRHQAGAAYMPSRSRTKTGPQPGAIEDGYRFKGGDPSNPSNWERVR